MTPTRSRTRELAERTSSGTLVRLFWRQGTRELWVEVWEREFDVTIVIPAEPEQALETFHHPYAYEGGHENSGSRSLPAPANSWDDAEEWE
jgi:hypothetical protein